MLLWENSKIIPKLCLVPLLIWSIDISNFSLFCKYDLILCKYMHYYHKDLCDIFKEVNFVVSLSFSLYVNSV